MKIPKGINKALNNRRTYAAKINMWNKQVAFWLEAKNIIVDDEDIKGLQTLSDPEGSVERIRAAILAKPVKKKIEKDDELMYLRRFISYIFCDLNADVSTDDSCFGIAIDNLPRLLDAFNDFCYNMRKKKTDSDIHFSPELPMKINAYSKLVMIQYDKIDFESIGTSKDVFQEILKEYEHSK
ncbi:hypothetical protein QMP26_41785 (plasmid) [Enterocloster clostridioformis]